MPERIPLLEERLTNLTARIDAMHKENKDDLLNLKQEHILDVRKNICRLWMSYDDMRRALQDILIQISRVKGTTEARTQFINIVFALLGAMISGVGVYIAFGGHGLR